MKLCRPATGREWRLQLQHMLYVPTITVSCRTPSPFLGLRLFGRKLPRNRVSDRRLVSHFFQPFDGTEGLLPFIFIRLAVFHSACQLELNVLLSDLALCSQHAYQGAERRVEGLKWQPQANRTLPIERYRTSNSKIYCRKLGRWYRTRSVFIRRTNPQSHLHGPRRHTNS
jgi:hypothetical protein